MTTQHEKSPCCRGKIIRFGERRRQCTLCRKTWRVWQRSRGRKKKRKNIKLVFQYLDCDFVSLRKEAKQRKVNESSLRRSLKKSTQHFVATTEWKKICKKGPYVLMADAVIKYIKRKWYTVYVVAIKQPNQAVATIFPPQVLQGKESYHGWRKVLDDIPEETRKKVAVLTCDSHKGLVYYARWSGWKVQRCQAHLIFALAGRRSRSHWSRHQKEGEQIYQLTKIIFTTKKLKVLNSALTKIEALGWETNSRTLRSIINGFVRSYEEYRTSLENPCLNIPTTNNAMESFFSQFQELCHRARGFSSVESLTLWATAFAKHKKQITCNGARRQPIKLH
jgi:transposase-like protein